MIKHSLKEDLIHLSIDKMDFSYRVPVKKLGNIIDWKIGEEGIVLKDVSSWALQLFTKKVTAEKYVSQFKDIVQEFSPNNTINWEETALAITIQNEYNDLLKTNAANSPKLIEAEMITSLKKKYKLDE